MHLCFIYSTIQFSCLNTPCVLLHKLIHGNYTPNVCRVKYHPVLRKESLLYAEKSAFLRTNANIRLKFPTMQLVDIRQYRSLI